MQLISTLVKEISNIYSFSIFDSPDCSDDSFKSRGEIFYWHITLAPFIIINIICSKTGVSCKMQEQTKQAAFKNLFLSVF